MLEPSLWVGLAWLLGIAIIIFAQHHVCDAYFLPAINVFVERRRKSPRKFVRRWGDEAVASATICALGCNSPELFTNLISLFTGSDAGIGVVIGSEIFNFLFIIGCAVLAAPVMPLELDRVPFARDCLFYAVAIALLYWALRDKAVQLHECFVLLSAAATYVTAVYFTEDLINCCPCLRRVTQLDQEAPPRPAAPAKSKGKIHGIEVYVEEIHHSRMADRAAEPSAWTMDVTAHGIYAEPAGDLPTRMRSSGNLQGGRCASLGFQFDNPHAMLGPILRYKDLREVVVQQRGAILLEFHSGLHHVTLKLTVDDSDKRAELLRNIERYSLGRPWVHGYDATAIGAVKHLVHTLRCKEASLVDKLWAIPEFVIDFLLKGTLWMVDVKDINKEGRWLPCFLGSMLWLAVFSYFMLLVAEQIHYHIPVLPSSFLGITVCAIGSAIPNLAASVLMAQQNKPAAAIANALGANVQNIFLAMALPWLIYSLHTGGQDISQKVAGITEGVFWMMGTLAIVLLFVLVPPPCVLTKVYGWVLVAGYLAYLVFMSGETFGWWPPLLA